jgi:hypothetical protein
VTFRSGFHFDQLVSQFLDTSEDFEKIKDWSVTELGRILELVEYLEDLVSSITRQEVLRSMEEALLSSGP